MRKKLTRRHRLLVYYRIGQRWRIMPLLTALFGVLIYGMTWLHAYGRFEGGNEALLEHLWLNRTLVLAIIGLNLLLYGLITIVARGSFVEARRNALRVRAGLLPLNISYARVRQLRLGQVSGQLPPDRLRNRDYALLEPLLPLACTVIDLKSWPREPIRRLWDKFLFTPDRKSLLFIVEDAMLLNQQIDSAMAAWQARVRGRDRYEDPIERAARMQQRARRG
ncbi:MAG TPA: hypothetical protein VKY39_04515 [Aggregatilineales bacterium]|nr:hypothetical protein [Aggregatilineales bacterium]